MISIKDIIRLHDLSIEVFGGASGVRDYGLLESAVGRPYQTFGSVDLYPTAYEKAAALAESIIINHPFVDGNKRTGFLAMLAILKMSKIEFDVTNNEIYNFTIQISTGEIKFEGIVEWLKNNTKTV